MNLIRSGQKRLILVTLACLFAISAVVMLINREHLPKGIDIKVEGQPTIGFTKAKVNVVVFEEPKCVNCKDFTLEIYPKIKQHYIDSGKITYTIIPVSFLPGSMPAAMALYCVYYSDADYPNSELFFKYLHYMFHHFPGEGIDWATSDTLIKMASETSPAINISSLEKCVENEKYRVQIRKNTEYGKNMMGGTISTPTVFVNGIEVKELTFENIAYIIDEVLEREGVTP